MKKLFQRFVASAILLMATFAFALPVHAQGFSLLPSTKLDDSNCRSMINDYNAAEDQKAFLTVEGGVTRNDLLACGIKTGEIGLDMIPYYISYVTNFLLGLSGLICVLFIVIGGYHYVLGGLTEEKEKGKNTIKHALMGLGIALLSWTIVTVLINAVTG